MKLNININYEITHKLNLYLDSNEQHITDSIHELSSQINLKRIEQRNALKILLLNLFITPSEKVRTPRAKKSLGTKRYNPLKIGYSALRTVLDTLDKHGLVIQEIGLKDVEADISKMTTILATKKLGGWFDQYQWTKKDIDITEKEFKSLAESCHWITRLSYKMGGATLATYKDADVKKGEFSRRFAVYKQKYDPYGRVVIKETTKDKRMTHWVPEVQL